ncbi:MAG: oligosaccharide flippase family protein [Lautropia sp.]|nr:oligosaccharide flippase family protein [Lautropia sp.]
MYRSKLLWSVTGLATPLISAAVFIPLLLSRIGNERFGIIALAWALLSSASALDLGIGRATTQYLATLRGQKKLYEVPATIGVAWRLSLTYSVLGALVFLILIAFDVESLINHETVSAAELKTSALIVISVLPIQVLTALYRGISEAFEDFKATSLVRLYLGVVNFAGPFLVSLYTDSLVALTTALFVCRLAGLVMQYYAANRWVRKVRAGLVRHGDRHARIKARDGKAIRKQLNRFGKWMTVSNIAHPLLMQSDRFIIASAISAAAVTAYYIPYEIIIQSTMIASAVTTVMFPMLTARLQASPEEGRKVFLLWRNRLLIVSALLYVVLSIAFPVILHYWMGDKVGPESTTIGQILCLGAFFYTVSVIYTSYLHAQGRVRICATIQLIELAIYIPVLYFVTMHYGLYGAAISWVCRSFFDAAALAFVASRRTPQVTASQEQQPV